MTAGKPVLKREYAPKVTNWFPREEDNTGGNYSLVADQGMWELATQPWLGTDTRLLCAAIAKANVYGHAAFKRSELREILRGPKDNPCAENTLKLNMNKLKSGQAISPYSTPHCVVLASNTFRKGGRLEVTCKEETHTGYELSHWVKGIGWEAAPGTYQDLLDQGNGLALMAIQAGHKVTIETETTTRQRVTVEPLAMPPANRCRVGGCDLWSAPDDGWCGLHRPEQAPAAEAAAPKVIQGIAEPA